MPFLMKSFILFTTVRSQESDFVKSCRQTLADASTASLPIMASDDDGIAGVSEADFLRSFLSVSHHCLDVMVNVYVLLCVPLLPLSFTMNHRGE